MRTNSLNHFKSAFVHQFFVSPADEDYLMARWTYINGLHHTFFWHAAQAVEKYMKASLVLNEISVRKLGHDIPSLYEKFINISDGLAPEIMKPEGLDEDFWKDEETRKFINKLHRQGSPDSRYDLISYDSNCCEMFYLDQICFGIRRLSVGLDWVVDADWQVTGQLEGFKGHCYRDALTAIPDLQPRGSPKLPSLRTNIAGTTHEDLFHAWNFSYTRDDADLNRPPPQTLTNLFGQIKNSYVYLLVETLRKPVNAQDPHFIQGVRWLLENVRLEHNAKEVIKNLLPAPLTPKSPSS